MFTIKQLWNTNEQEEVLLVGLFQEPKLTGVLADMDNGLNGTMTDLIKEGDLSNRLKSIKKLNTLGQLGTKRIYFAGLGKREDFTYDKARSTFGRAVQEITKENRTHFSILLDTFHTNQLSIDKLAHAFSEAAGTAVYKFEDYKKKSNEPQKRLETITVYTENSEAKAGLTSGFAYAKGINFARDLVNTPANLLTPTDLAAEAIDVALEYGMEYEILEKEDMEKLGMGAILAVSKGSDQLPKLITVKYQGGKKEDSYVALVGKGLTFDAGGYSIKPALNMHEMKSDMGGSAAVLGAMEAIGRLKPEINIMFVIPSSENLINGEAMKPGDVITSLSGKTIEVRNTDAEGRLILADAITYAKEQGAKYIVDVATLTGGVVVALGDCTTGALTNNEDFYEHIKQSAADEAELLWLLPSFQPFKDMLKTSDVADLNNSTGRLGHAITGGLFVGEFAENTPWVHLDIAGTAYSGRSTELGPKGATGVMVRTLVNFVRNFKA
ncbi:leucyl aminopeptidase [Fictibacillus phosphorivorans]|uniref:leucyl aminopeptidase n=1 Tax=Fictibacillus phosphorivorans TaxID=1221500 RepID=UPI001292CF61|nr:leucyl aminopeptidase [Fictibacillus phosphorivorans]MQR95123.1 leucyl aminopeptidase [Fictibacillus phosphorivorans]